MIKRLKLLPLLLGFLGIFGVVAWALGPDFIAAVRSYRWQATPCVVVSSRVTEEPFSSTVIHYVLKVEFTYTFEGRDFRSLRFTTGDRQGSTDAGKAQQAAIRYPAGGRATCYVNPKRPTEAVLERGELWGGLFLVAPFLLVGLMMHEEIFSWFDRRRIRAQTNRPLSELNDALRADKRHLSFGCLAAVMGTFLLVFCLLLPFLEWSASRSWMEVDATIIRCQLDSRSGQHGPEYSLQLLYEYEFASQHYRSDRRDFGLSIDEPVTDLAAWARAHPPGTRVRCFVNPQDPADAVLERDIKVGWVPIALGGFMLIFGSYMLLQVAMTLRQRRDLTGPALINSWRGQPMQSLSVLRVSPSPFMLAMASLSAALILSSLGTYSLSKAIRALRDWQGDMINLLYGGAAIVGAGWCIFQFFKHLKYSRRPEPTLRLSPGTPKVGSALKLEWKFRDTGRTGVAWTRLTLEGMEQAKIRVTSTGVHGAMSEEKVQDTVFLQLPLTESAGRETVAGCVSLQLPDQMMHTFRAAKCAVLWRIRVEYGSRPDERLERQFPITILPSSTR